MEAVIESAMANVDFVTATVKDAQHGADVMRKLEHVFYRYPRLRYWEFLRRYRGKVASGTEKGSGGIAAGTDHDGAALVQAWGEHCEDVAEILIGGMAVHFTRCDLAVTMLYSSPLPTILELFKTLPHNDHKYSVVTNGLSEGGTLYIGSRQSEVFARMYDKGSELGTIPPCLFWRYEVELKGKHAEKAIEQLFYSGIGADRRSSLILGYVYEYFTTHHLPMQRVTDQVIGWPVIRYESRVSDNETTLRWFRNQVAPAIERLAGDGALAKALAALRIEDWGQPLIKWTDQEMVASQGHFLDKLQLSWYDGHAQATGGETQAQDQDSFGG